MQASPELLKPYYQDGWITQDLRRHEVFVNGQEVHLTPIEWKILEVLLGSPGDAIVHEMTCRHIWGRNLDNGLVASLKWHISNLRRKLGDEDLSHIVTIWGWGYSYRPPQEA